MTDAMIHRFIGIMVMCILFASTMAVGPSIVWKALTKLL
jgi:hypothetical protein